MATTTVPRPGCSLPGRRGGPWLVSPISSSRSVLGSDGILTASSAPCGALLTDRAEGYGLAPTALMPTRAVPTGDHDRCWQRPERQRSEPEGPLGRHGVAAHG